MDLINFGLEIQPLAEERLAVGGFWCGPVGGCAFCGWPDALAQYQVSPFPERLRQQIPGADKPPDPLCQAEQAERLFHQAVLNPQHEPGSPFHDYGQWLLEAVLLGQPEVAAAFDAACAALGQGNTGLLRFLLRFTSAEGQNRLCDRFQRLTYELAHRTVEDARPGPRGFLLEPYAAFHVVLYRVPRQGASGKFERWIGEPTSRLSRRLVARQVPEVMVPTAPRGHSPSDTHP